ncbi:MAG: sulfur oxidation c-type cytochrome SoxA [Gammaproteobacteria bacterium]|nr:sulfur oxidation c-type cytochrome SoxA [Gammaproteobacteria bacterium]
MNHISTKTIAGLLLLGLSSLVSASPESDAKAFKKYFTDRFPDVPYNDYINGAYTIDKSGRENWEAIEEFPPYEPFIDEGRAMWEKPFKNGKTFKTACFPDGPAIKHKYPMWDKEKKMVMTLPLALNNCLKANGEKPMKYKKGPINNIMAYLAYEARGKKINVVIPKDEPGALAAYEEGKKFYFQRRGQLNFSCASCHMQNAGLKLRSEILSPALGHPSGFPVYRSKWGTVGTLHRRFTGCNKQVRAKAFKAHGPEYRNLEYFLTAMSNGLEWNGPSARK